MTLDNILLLPSSAVIILKKSGLASVSYTTSMAAYLETLYTKFKGIGGIEMEVVSVGADIETLRLHTEYYRAKFAKEGKLLEHYGRKTIEYNIKIIASKDFKYVDVELVSARGVRRKVARFGSRGQAQEFIDLYYGEDNPFRFPVYAINQDTVDLLSTQQPRLFKI